MRWSPEEYPDRWEPYEPRERQEAVRIANELFEHEGYDEEQALRIAEDQALSKQEGTTTPQGRTLEDNAAYDRDAKDEEEQNPTGHRPSSQQQESPTAANRDQLEQWPRDRLLEYASQQGLDVDPQASRQEIIDRLS